MRRRRQQSVWAPPNETNAPHLDRHKACVTAIAWIESGRWSSTGSYERHESPKPGRSRRGTLRGSPCSAYLSVTPLRNSTAFSTADMTTSPVRSDSTCRSTRFKHVLPSRRSPVLEHLLGPGMETRVSAARLTFPRGGSSVGRAPALQAGSRRFESAPLHPICCASGDACRCGIT
jgi:hypothetical protein